MTLPKPREIEARTGIPARRASDYLRGVRWPKGPDLLAILDAFPELDARWLVRRMVAAANR